MGEVGLVGLFLVTGLILGMACVVMSMWILLALYRRLGALQAINLSEIRREAPKQSPQQNPDLKLDSRDRQVSQLLKDKGLPEVGTVITEATRAGKEHVVQMNNSPLVSEGGVALSEEMLAAMAATLCAYGANHEKYQIKQVRLVNQ